MEQASLLIENLEVSLSQGLLKPRKKILFEVSLKVLPASIYAFLGPNGAGKTTTIKSILGLIPAFSGKIELFGQEVGDPGLRSRVGYAPENAYFSHYLTPREILRSLGYLSGLARDTLQERARSWLELLGLLDVQDQQVKTFSKGMKQRLALVQALVHDPDLLIFDEPTTGLDPLGRNYVKELLRELKRQGKAVFLSSHHLLDVQEICDDFCILNQGHILLEGSSKELLGNDENLEDFFVKKVREDGG